MPLIDVCAEGEIDDGAHRLVDVGGGIEVAVFFVQGAYYAIEDVCTHDYGPLAEGPLCGFEVECPRHGARFDVRTGEATRLPAYRAVERYDVRIVDGRVCVDA